MSEHRDEMWEVFWRGVFILTAIAVGTIAGTVFILRWWHA